jgi:hypothetical protein
MTQSAAPAGTPVIPNVTGDLPDVGGEPANGSAQKPAQTPAPSGDPLIPEPAAPQPEPAGEEFVTGDPALDIALNFFVKAGIKIDDPVLVKASDTGDFTLLEAKLATLPPEKARGWEQHVALAKGVHAKLEGEAKAKTEATAKLINDTVGGEQVWNDIKAWAATNAEPAEREAVNSALKAGGLQAKAMAAYLQGQYVKKTGASKEPSADVTAPGAKPGAGTGNYALSPREYAQAVQDLAAKVGANRVDGHPEYKELQRRRYAWRAPR